MIYESLVDGISKFCLQGIFVFIHRGWFMVVGGLLPWVMYYRGFTPPSIVYHPSGVWLPNLFGNQVLKGRHTIDGVCKPPAERTINIFFYYNFFNKMNKATPQ